MEQFPNIIPENKIEKPKVKEGVDFVFEQNPELFSIGTPEQYSKYLDVTFPDSQMRKIVYHGTTKIFDNFKKPKDLDSGRENGIYFTSTHEDEKGAKFYSRAATESSTTNKIIPAVLNITKLEKVRMSKITDILDGDLENYVDNGIDDLYGELIDRDGNYILNEYAVFEPEQIHILGSKADLDGFKNFVEHNL
jgi:hypothetical protein